MRIDPSWQALSYHAARLHDVPLRELIADSGRRQHLAAVARQRAQSFSREVMARGYAALYDELLGGAERREVA